MEELTLSWKQMVEIYGEALVPHQRLLEKATQATHGLMACSAVPEGHLALGSQDGAHAEERLLRSSLWQDQVAAAIQGWKSGQREILTLLAINRAPCAHCAQLLAASLHALRKRCGAAMQPHRFVLASLGYYQGKQFMNGQPSPYKQSRPGTADAKATFSKEVTTNGGLRALRDAGWHLRVTEFGSGPTRRGDELLEFLARM